VKQKYTQTPHNKLPVLNRLIENTGTPTFVICSFAFILIFIIVLDHSNSWMHPEVYPLQEVILKDGAEIKLKDFYIGFNTPIFDQWGNRISRPLSHIFETIDLKLRAKLWNYITPHPSLSLTLIFLLILSPFLLFRLLRNMGCKIDNIWFSITLYVGSSGFLSLIACYFRPAKAMTNFSIVLVLYLASKLNLKYLENENKSIPLNKFMLFYSVVFFSFFWDETAPVLIFPALIVFFPKLFLNPFRALMFVLLPLFTLVSYIYVLPFMTKFFGFTHAGLHKIPIALDNTVTDWVGDIHVFKETIIVTISESLALFPLGSVDNLFWALMFKLNLVSFLILVLLAFYFMVKSSLSKKDWIIILKPVFILLFLIGSIGLHYVTQSLHGNSRGIYYHGSYIPLILCIFMAVYLQTIRKFRIMFTISLIFFVPVSMYKFYYTNNYYRYVHYYTDYWGHNNKMFNGEVNRYVMDFRGNTDSFNYSQTKIIWEELKPVSYDRNKIIFSLKKITRGRHLANAISAEYLPYKGISPELIYLIGDHPRGHF